MPIDSISSTGIHLVLRIPTPQAGGEVVGKETKSLGETPPVVLDVKTLGPMAALFSSTGFVGRLRKRLNYLKNKKCIIVPAKGTVACVDDQDVVYLGVDFLSSHLEEPETIAGVLSHEWGHACALKPHHDEIQQMNWNQIFELRRAHETLADEISGRLLFHLGYTPDGLIRFLNKGKDTHNLKYHDPVIRSQVILYGFEVEKRKSELAKKLFSDSTYKNPYASILLDIA